MRILFIHEVNYLDKVIFEMHEFPELLALRGHEVTFFHYPEHPTSPRVSLRTRRESISGRAYPDAKLTLVTPPTFGGKNAERLVAPLLDSPSLRHEIKHGDYDAIVLYAVPTTGWQTVHFARSAGVPVIFRALDVSHEIRGSVFTPLIKMAERFIYRNAALVSANNPAMAKYCADFSKRVGPVEVNLPPVDLTHFQGELESIRSRYGLQTDDRVITYMGSFFDFSGLDRVIPSMVEDFKRDDKLRLLLIGGGSLDVRLREITMELGLEDRVIFTGVVPYADLPAHLRAADIAINPFVAQQVTNVAFPHKVLQYMAAGIPTVSTSLAGLRGVLGDNAGVTWASTPEEVASDAVALLRASPESLAAITSSQRDFIGKTFSLEGSVSSLERAIESVR